MRRVLVPAGFAALIILIGYALEQGARIESMLFRIVYLLGGAFVGWLASVLMHRQLALQRAFEEQTRALSRSAERLRRQEEQVRIAIEATGLYLWVWDLRTNDMEIGDELRLALGMHPTEQMTVERYIENVHPEDRDRVMRVVNELLERGGRGQVEYRLQLERGVQRTIHATVMVQLDALGEPVQMMGALNDITERRELEERLRQSQKMESIGTLAGGIAHDFNNLITAMLGHGQFAMASLPQDSDVRQEVEAMLIAADRASLLTRQLLAFSRRQIMQPRMLDLNDVVRDIARLLHRIIGEDIRLELELGAEPFEVHADAGQLTQVLLNLATNARDAMPRGGTFRIVTSAETIGKSRAAAMEIRPGRYAIIQAHDTGVGMDGATLERIFDPYFTTKPVGRGTGLGLSMAYGIVRQSNGHIHVESEPGRGTSFHVLLPIATAEA
ncbi:MAG: two-component system sensor histidine kinase NtrB [Longimicrobiales bacterium]